MSYFLPRIIGYSRAVDLFFTSRAVDGEEAYRLGLLDRIVEPGEELSCAQEVAAQMAALPPMALRSGKRVFSGKHGSGLPSRTQERNVRSLVCSEVSGRQQGAEGFVSRETSAKVHRQLIHPRRREELMVLLVCRFRRVGLSLNEVIGDLQHSLYANVPRRAHQVFPVH